VEGDPVDAARLGRRAIGSGGGSKVNMKNQQNPHIAWNDFALLVPGATADKAKSRLPLNKPVNLLTGAGGGGKSVNGAPASKAHVVILNANRQLYIRDLTGTAGLQVRNELVDGAELAHGDNVRLGKMQYEVFATERSASDTMGGAPSAALYAPPSPDPIPLRLPVTVLGTNDSADIRVTSSGPVADVLVMIVSLGGRFWLWDLQPANAAKIDGKPVTRAELPDGCTVSIGDNQFRFQVAPLRVAPGAPDRAARNHDGAPPATAAPTTPADIDIDSDVQTLPAAGVEQFRQWGALAFAVASANQAELHDPTVPLDPTKFGPPKTPSRWRIPIMILITLIVVAAIAAAAIYAWGRWKHLSAQ